MLFYFFHNFVCVCVCSLTLQLRQPPNQVRQKCPFWASGILGPTARSYVARDTRNELVNAEGPRVNGNRARRVDVTHVVST